MKPSNRGKKAPTSIDFIGKREEEGTSSPSSMDGALAWRRETRSARDGRYGLKYSTRHQAKAAPRQPPLD